MELIHIPMEQDGTLFPSSWQGLPSTQPCPAACCGHLLVLRTLGTLARAPRSCRYPTQDSSSGSIFTTISCFTPAHFFSGEEKAAFGFLV